MAPIGTLRLMNWKGFSSNIPLWPVTFLVGPNGGGKSSLLESLALISHLARRGSLREDLRQWLRGWPGGVYSQGTKETTISIEWSERRRRSSYAITLQGTRQPSILKETLKVGDKNYILTDGLVRKFFGVGPGKALIASSPHESALALFARSPQRRRKAEAMIDLVTRIEVYALDADFLRGTAHDSRPLPYARKGTSLVAGLIDAKRDSKRWSSVLAALRSIQPDLVDIEISERPRGVLLKYLGGRESELDEESDGLVRAAGMFLVRYRPECPAVLGFDEPENGYHLSRLVEVVSRIAPEKSASSGGPAVVLMATHSPGFVRQAVELMPDRTGVVSLWRSQDGTVVTRDWEGSQLRDEKDFLLMHAEAFQGR